MGVVDIRMLRWMCGVKLYIIRNAIIRGTRLKFDHLINVSN